MHIYGTRANNILIILRNWKAKVDRLKLYININCKLFYTINIFTNIEKFLLHPLRELKDYDLKDFLKVQTNQQNDKVDFFNSHYLHHYRFIKKEKQKIKFIKAMYDHFSAQKFYLLRGSNMAKLRFKRFPLKFQTKLTFFID